MRYLIIMLLFTGQALSQEYNAEVTHYCPCHKCCNKTDGVTASGSVAKPYKTLALPKQFPFGSKVYVNGKLLGVCEDRGGAIKMKGTLVKIDVFVPTHQEALLLGRYKTIVEITP